MRSPFLTVVLSAFSSLALHAGPIVFSTGFEGPTYSLGTVNGQDGWDVFNPAFSTDTVENTLVKSGTQALRIVPNGSLQSGPFHPSATLAPVVELNADLYLQTGTGSNSAWQFAGMGGSLVPFLGGIYISETNSIQLLTSGYTLLGTAWTRDAWHNVDLLFNYTTQTFNFSLDGIKLASNVPFCGDAGSCSGGSVSPGSFTSYFAVFATPRSSDLGFMDNVTVTANPVPEPEPSSLFLIAPAFLLAVAKFRRK